MVKVSHDKEISGLNIMWYRCYFNNVTHISSDTMKDIAISYVVFLYVIYVHNLPT